MKHYSDSFKQRCVSGVKKRMREGIKVGRAIRLVADFEKIPAKSVEDWWYQSKKVECVQAQAGAGVVYPLAGTEKAEEPSAHLPIEPVVEPTKAVLRSKEPEAPYLRTDQGLNRCSRCSSTNHLYQDADQLWFCGICQVHLPYEPVEDMEIKYTDSPYRKLHWMA